MVLSVEEIEEGTVVDHITAGKGILVMRLLEIDERTKGRVALVINVRSAKMGKKDIVKIEGKHMTQNVLDKIALISPSATINLIKDNKVIEKRNVILPEKLSETSKCPNPKCITNDEEVKTLFVKKDEHYVCHYCERAFRKEELV